MTTENENQTPDLEQAARRRLLQLAAYTPPAILGVMMSGTKVAEAANAGTTINCSGGQVVVSANGSACCPCIPTDPKYNPTTCAWERCKLGNCGACPPGPYVSKKDCDTVAAACGCVCTRQPGPGKGKRNWIYNCN